MFFASTFGISPRAGLRPVHGASNGTRKRGDSLRQEKGAGSFPRSFLRGKKGATERGVVFRSHFTAVELPPQSRKILSDARRIPRTL